jgi:hypothetical protein
MGEKHKMCCVMWQQKQETSVSYFWDRTVITKVS